MFKTLEIDYGTSDNQSQTKIKCVGFYISRLKEAIVFADTQRPIITLPEKKADQSNWKHSSL